MPDTNQIPDYIKEDAETFGIMAVGKPEENWDKQDERAFEKARDFFIEGVLSPASARYHQSPVNYDQPDLDKLYEWLMDENRKPAQTYFTSGTARNIAKEIEFRLAQSPVAETEEQRIKKRRGGGEEIPKGGWRESPVWVKGKKPEGKEHEKINIKYKGSPDVLVMIDTRWCWYEKDLKTSSFFIVQEDSWSEIEWLSETPSEEQGNIQARKEMSLKGDILDRDFEIQRLKTIMDQAGVKY